MFFKQELFNRNIDFGLTTSVTYSLNHMDSFFVSMKFVVSI